MTSAIETRRGRAGPPLSSAGWVRAWPLYPLLLLIVAFFLYPVLQILWLSLINRAGELSAENYLRATTTPVYLRTLGITLQISAWTTAFSLLAGYPVAYLLATLAFYLAFAGAAWLWRRIFRRGPVEGAIDLVARAAVRPRPLPARSRRSVPV